jgi:hypothetical protein
MIQFHSEDYVKFLSRVTPDNMPTLIPQLQKCAIAFRLRFFSFSLSLHSALMKVPFLNHLLFFRNHCIS